LSSTKSNREKKRKGREGKLDARPSYLQAGWFGMEKKKDKEVVPFRRWEGPKEKRRCPVAPLKKREEEKGAGKKARICPPR